MRNEWSGDIDMGDESLKKKHKEYLDYLSYIRGIGCHKRTSNSLIREDLDKQLRKLAGENEFLKKGHLDAKSIYNHKKDLPNIPEDSVFALAWDVEGYVQLVGQNEALSHQIRNILTRLGGQHHIGKELTDLRKLLQEYVKGVYMKKRDAASHLLLFMISDEFRNFKPYAIPVRVIKYKSITDGKLRELREELRSLMNAIGMTTVGM